MPVSFDNLNLISELLDAIGEQGYTEATPVQELSIPPILEGRDVLAGAQTGTGKTAAFTLPLLQNIYATGKKRKNPRALVLAPTRELAAQVYESLQTYGSHLPLRYACIFGGVSQVPQIEALQHGVDVLVATPGRLLDHLEQGNTSIAHVQTFVLDEADRMLDMGFLPDIKKVMKQLPVQRQNLLFSATYSKEIRKLASGLLNNPFNVDVIPENTAAETVDQKLFFVGKGRKRDLLSFVIRTENWEQALVFCRTKHGANRLVRQLNTDGIDAVAIHGNKSQGARTNALEDFKTGHVRVLVATDIAARGLDIDRLPHVVNYDLPNVAEDYVHRIGRTGRAGAAGEAISLVCAEDQLLLKNIEQVLGKQIPSQEVPGLTLAELPPWEEVEKEVHAKREEAKQNRGASRRTDRKSRRKKIEHKSDLRRDRERAERDGNASGEVNQDGKKGSPKASKSSGARRENLKRGKKFSDELMESAASAGRNKRPRRRGKFQGDGNSDSKFKNPWSGKKGKKRR